MAINKAYFKFFKVPNENQTYNVSLRDSGGVFYSENFTFINTVRPEFDMNLTNIYGTSVSLMLGDFKDSLFFLLLGQGYEPTYLNELSDSFEATVGTELQNIEWLFAGDELPKIVDDSIGDFIQFNQTAVVPVPPIEPIVRDEKIILSRSPFHFNESPSVNYDEMKLDLYIYRGHKIDDKPTIPNFNLSKRVIYAGQQTIGFNISNIVNDFVRNNLNEIGSSGVQTTSLFDTIWIYCEGKIYLSDVELYEVNQYLLALDGFGYHTELYNPEVLTGVLTTNTNHLAYSSTTYPLYFISDNLVSITINGNNVPFTLDGDVNNQKIGYINVMQYAGSSTEFNAEFEYLDRTEEHAFKVVEECRNSVANIVFKNKFGFWQKLVCPKLSKNSLDISNENYMPFISNFGSYSLNKHNEKNFMVGGTEKITVNTDYIPEYYNDVIKEMMLSEFHYIEQNNIVYPVNLDTKNIDFKTKLNNKLIQYTFNFKRSYNTINKII